MDSNNDTVEEPTPTPTPAPSATKNEVKKKKKPKTCHFLKSACDMTHTNSCVVVATKVDDETRTNDDMNISPHTHNDAQSANSALVDEFGRTIKRTKLDDNPIEIKSAPTHPQSAENTPDPGKDTKRKKKKKRTKVFTTSELPYASMNMNTTMISPEDALAQVHFPTKLYKEIVMYVKPLLILDVNGILCHRIRDNDLPNALRTLLKDIIPSKVYREPIGYVARSHIVPRTDITSFLEFLNEYYTLAIWSSAQKKTVKSLVHMLIPEKIRQNILFVWGQDRCECVQQGDGDGNGDGGDNIESNKVSEGPERKDAFQGIIFMKHLSKVWHYYPLFNKSNTLLIDDSPEKCKKFMENCIHPPPIVGLDMDFVISILKKSEQSQGDDSLGTNGVVQEVDAKQFCDEENQKKQLQFFTKLAARWKIASDHNGDDLLFSFLSENGKEHMNWCC